MSAQPRHSHFRSSSVNRTRCGTSSPKVAELAATKVADKIVGKNDRRVMRAFDTRLEAFGQQWEIKMGEKNGALERGLQALEEKEETRSRTSVLSLPSVAPWQNLLEVMRRRRG